ncbi:MAG: tetratricopeptide repeat protein, partial [Archaeoglobaceae archaeon]
DRSSALSSVAKALAKVGRVDEALEAAKSISDKKDRSWALSSVAIDLAEAGRFDEALEVARSIPDESPRSRALAKIAETITIPKVKIEIPKRILTENDELEILLDSEVELENALVEFEGIKIEPVSIKKLKSEKIKIKPDLEPGKKNLKIRVSYDFKNMRYVVERGFEVEIKISEKIAELLKIEERLKLNPKDVRLLNMKGNILCDLGKYEEAIECYKRVLELDPNNLAAKMNLIFVKRKIS